MNRDFYKKMLHCLAVALYPLTILITNIETDIRLYNAPNRGRNGFCFTFWDLKAKILKNRYGIDWKTPPEKHPGVHYD